MHTAVWAGTACLNLAVPQPGYASALLCSALLSTARGEAGQRNVNTGAWEELEELEAASKWREPGDAPWLPAPVLAYPSAAPASGASATAAAGKRAPDMRASRPRSRSASRKN